MTECKPRETQKIGLEVLKGLKMPLGADVVALECAVLFFSFCHAISAKTLVWKINFIKIMNDEKLKHFFLIVAIV